VRSITIPIALVLAAVTAAMVVRGIAVSAHTGQGDDGLAAAKAATARIHNLDIAKASGHCVVLVALSKHTEGRRCVETDRRPSQGVATRVTRLPLCPSGAGILSQEITEAREGAQPCSRIQL
jgi:hypothetical protein